MASEGTYDDWMEIAERDLLAAESLGQAGFYEHACFWCQQAVEKALKALLIHQTGDFPKTHSLRELASKAGVFEKLKENIAFLESDYTVTRYLNIDEKPASKTYDRKKFEQRRESANKTLELVKSWTSD